MITELLRRLRSRRGDIAHRTDYSDKATVDDIRACFRLILGRNPNSEEWTGHSSRAGEDLKLVVSSFLQSSEFSRREMLISTRFQRYEVVEVNDVKVAIHPEDMDVGREVDKLVYEPNVTALFKARVKPGMRVVDVGANCGYFTFLAGKLAGDQGEVYAVEPHVSNVRLLEIGRRANGFDNVCIVPVAAGARAGIATLRAAHTNGVTDDLSDQDDIMEVSLVPQVPLDAIACDVDFIKLDIEGREFDALQGFSAGLSKRPLIVSEFFPGMLRLQNVTGERYLQFILSHGYQIGVIDPAGEVASFHREPHPIVQAFLDSQVDHIDIFAIPT